MGECNWSRSWSLFVGRVASLFGRVSNALALATQKIRTANECFRRKQYIKNRKEKKNRTIRCIKHGSSVMFVYFPTASLSMHSSELMNVPHTTNLYQRTGRSRTKYYINIYMNARLLFVWYSVRCTAYCTDVHARHEHSYRKQVHRLHEPNRAHACMHSFYIVIYSTIYYVYIIYIFMCIRLCMYNHYIPICMNVAHTIYNVHSHCMQQLNSFKRDSVRLGESVH